MKVKGWITHEQEQAGYKFAQIYARVFATPRLSSPSFEDSGGRTPTPPWERMSDEAKESIEKAEAWLLKLLGNQTKYGYSGGVLTMEEAAVLNRYVLTDSLPEWLQVPYRDESKLKSLREFQAICSAVKKLAVAFGLE